MKSFKCPECGRNKLEEVLSDAIVTSAIGCIDIENQTMEYVYGDFNIEDGIIKRYQCSKCGYVLKGVETVEDLCEWIKQH